MRAQRGVVIGVAIAAVFITSTAGAAGIPRVAAPRISKAQRVFDAMTEPQRVGQLLMVDSPSSGPSSATVTAITTYHAGSVILDGTDTAGLQAVKKVTARLRSLAPSDAGLFIATDQEGGEVQRLQGSGFSRIPSALDQGRIDASTLQDDAGRWGIQLRHAGVNVDLAPVLDTVPSGFGSNPPIGDLDREYGHTTGRVSSHAEAVIHGLQHAAIDVTVKHFPGLGRVHTNTDTSRNVTDTVTTSTDAYLAPFRTAIRAGVPFVMVSSAIYSRIDAHHPAAFSSKIVTGLLKKQLGFTGIVISDDLGAAAQVSGYSVAARAVDFVQAGGDMILTVDADQAKTMTAALLARARSTPAFKRRIDAAALLVLQTKQARGLLG